MREFAARFAQRILSRRIEPELQYLVSVIVVLPEVVLERWVEDVHARERGGACWDEAQGRELLRHVLELVPMVTCPDGQGGPRRAYRRSGRGVGGARVQATRASGDAFDSRPDCVGAWRGQLE